VKFITTHLHADFDCLASMVAAKKLYPDAEMVFPGAQEKPVRDFLERGDFNVNYRRLKGFPLEQARLMVVVDASTRERIGLFSAVADREDVKVHIYDHHPSGNIDIPHELAEVRDRGATVIEGHELKPLGRMSKKDVARVRAALDAAARVNDLPGSLLQIRRSLRPDGLFLAALLGVEMRDYRRFMSFLRDSSSHSLQGAIIFTSGISA